MWLDTIRVCAHVMVPFLAETRDPTWRNYVDDVKRVFLNPGNLETRIYLWRVVLTHLWRNLFVTEIHVVDLRAFVTTNSMFRLVRCDSISFGVTMLLHSQL